jgi:NAD(P)-dependent dehydrogenase (short-subunit alcohol dehydrogenase family)
MDPAVTARFEKLSPDVLAECYRIYIPQKQAPTEDDLANAVLFFASDLSRAITGTVLHVDGGTMAASGIIDWPFGDGFGPAPMAGTLNAMFGTSG